ncbi:alanine/glycine:cation symporter family protein [Tannockella kyphosi]|uniref:alanine/glycine:cation symporter family protein n=1 Tax=Tannockella kyphosi TaxID=2899121 RepID=UPI0020138D5B|nr:alanine/glycine:cation symporter family protein [Tannockella kyphosi]
MIEQIEQINGIINGYIWGVPALTLLIGTGILMTLRTKGFQFRYFKHMWDVTIGAVFKNKDITSSKDKNSISQFQALCTALSATIGTGNITGIAVAITSGGPGAIFWMWIAAIVGMMTNFSENVLGIFYRRKNKDGEWCGGAMYYLEDGLGAKFKTLGKVLAVLFASFAMIASFGIGNMGQVSSIKESILTAAGATGNVTASIVIGLVIMFLAGLVILGGITRIAKANEKIVPAMAGVYILGAIIIIVMHSNQIIPAFQAIFSHALSSEAITGGTLGTAITWGFKRGVFSNEAGLGSSVIVHSASNVKEPVVQGLWGIFEVFFDTIIVCTLTALVILTSGLVSLETGVPFNSDLSSLGLVTEIFGSVFGTLGGVFLAVAITLFAFSTVLGWSYYGTKSCEYLFGTKASQVYKLAFLGVVVVGCVLDASLIIDISDTFNGFMAIPNLIGVVTLSGLVVKITNNYVQRVIKKKDIEPMLSNFADLQALHAKEIAEK